MKNHKLTLVAGFLAALGLSGQVSALPTTTTPDLVINISGASAQQNPLNQLLVSFCRAGTLTQYNASGAGNWRSYFCEVDQSVNPTVIPASLDGLNVLFNNRAAGGSIWGVVPVARQWAVEYMNIFSGSCTTTGSGTETCPISTRAGGLQPFAAGTGGLECPFTPYSADPTEVYTATTSGTIFAHVGTTAQDTVCLKSDGGVSDVEPALFSSSQNFPGFTGGPLTESELGSLTVLSEYGIIFGVSVNDRIYRQLQEQQYGTGAGNPPIYANALNPPPLFTDPDGTDLSDALRPSLPKTIISSLFSGKLQTWKDVDQSLDTLSPFMGVCRRVVGSGTQAANNVFLMGNPCLGSAAKTMVSDPAGGGNGNIVGQQLIKNNSGSSDVERCQTFLQDATLPGFVGLPADSIGFNAINRTLSPNEHWRFVKIDGVDPTVDNVIAGKYNHVFEQTLQFPASSSPVVVDALTMVAVGSGDPATIVGAGIDGVVALPALGFDWETDPGTWRGGRGGNSCSPVELEPDAP